MGSIDRDWVTQHHILRTQIDKDAYIADALEDNVDTSNHLLKMMAVFTASVILNVTLFIVVAERADMGDWQILLAITLVVICSVGEWLCFTIPKSRTIKYAAKLTGQAEWTD